MHDLKKMIMLLESRGDRSLPHPSPHTPLEKKEQCQRQFLTRFLSSPTDQEVTTSRDEALRSNEALRERLEEFERTLKDATEDAHALLDEKDAALRRVGSEREREREAHKQG